MITPKDPVFGQRVCSFSFFFSVLEEMWRFLWGFSFTWHDLFYSILHICVISLLPVVFCCAPPVHVALWLTQSVWVWCCDSKLLQWNCLMLLMWFLSALQLHVLCKPAACPALYTCCRRGSGVVTGCNEGQTGCNNMFHCEELTGSVLSPGMFAGKVTVWLRLFLPGAQVYMYSWY